MKKNLFVKGILPWLCTGILLILFFPLYMSDGEIDYFFLWIIMGFPYGIRRLRILVVPHGYGLSGSIGIIVFICIISGLFGGLIWIYKLIVSVWILISFAVFGIKYVIEKKVYRISI